MTPDTATADSEPKATLFCPNCGHRSRYDGDWTRAESGDTVHYLCPDCHTEITTRPASSEPTTGSAQRFWTNWTDAVRAWQNVWWESILHP